MQPMRLFFESDESFHQFIIFISKSEVDIRCSQAENQSNVIALTYACVCVCVCEEKPYLRT